MGTSRASPSPCSGWTTRCVTRFSSGSMTMSASSPYTPSVQRTRLPISRRMSVSSSRRQVERSLRAGVEAHRPAWMRRWRVAVAAEGPTGTSYSAHVAAACLPGQIRKRTLHRAGRDTANVGPMRLIIGRRRMVVVAIAAVAARGNDGSRVRGNTRRGDCTRSEWTHCLRAAPARPRGPVERALHRRRQRRKRPKGHAYVFRLPRRLARLVAGRLTHRLPAVCSERRHVSDLVGSAGRERAQAS